VVTRRRDWILAGDVSGFVVEANFAAPFHDEFRPEFGPARRSSLPGKHTVLRTTDGDVSTNEFLGVVYIGARARSSYPVSGRDRAPNTPCRTFGDSTFPFKFGEARVGPAVVAVVGGAVAASTVGPVFEPAVTVVGVVVAASIVEPVFEPAVGAFVVAASTVERVVEPVVGGAVAASTVAPAVGPVVVAVGGGAVAASTSHFASGRNGGDSTFTFKFGEARVEPVEAVAGVAVATTHFAWTPVGGATTDGAAADTYGAAAATSGLTTG
jgi:hypothetical protein